MTREEAINCIKYGIIDGNYVVPLKIGKEALNMAIKALEQEPTTKNNLSSGLEKNSKKLEKDFGELDCISRAEVIEEINSVANDAWDEEQMRVDLIAEINALPSVTPQERKGHWINKQRLFDSCSAECSSCHERSDGYMHDNGFSLECKYYDFCPKCGAQMESEG